MFFGRFMENHYTLILDKVVDESVLVSLLKKELNVDAVVINNTVVRTGTVLSLPNSED